MKRLIAVGIILLMGVIALPAAVRAEAPFGGDGVTTTPPVPTTQTSADVAALIRQLGADDFRVRLDAEHKLKAIGKPAIGALQEARKAQDPEVHARVEEILEEIERPAVNHSPVPQPTGYGGHSYSVSVNNGGKVVNVSEPGRTIHIEENAAGIVMKVTGQIDGKQVTRDYKAQSALQLKRDNPSAFDLYAQYTGANVGGGRFGLGNALILRQQALANLNGGAGGFIVGPGAGQPALQLRPNAHGDHLEALEQKILAQMQAKNLPVTERDVVNKLLKELQEGLPRTDEAGHAVNDLDAQVREYNRQCDALRKKLAELKLADPGDALPPPASARLGISAAEETIQGEGLTVTHILPDSRASRLGLKEQDTIRKVNGQDIHSTRELRRLVTENAGGLLIEGTRDGKPLKLQEAPVQQEKKPGNLQKAQ